MDIDGTGAFTFDTDSCNNPIPQEDTIELELAWRQEIKEQDGRVRASSKREKR